MSNIGQGSYSGQSLVWDQGNYVWKYPYPRIIEIDLFKGRVTSTTDVPIVIGGVYINASNWPGNYVINPRTVKLRCVLESTTVVTDYAAVVDLFDTVGTLSPWTPHAIAGSQIDTVLAYNPLVASMVESADISSVFDDSPNGVFEARFWMATSGGGNQVTCKSVQLIIEW